MLLNKDTQNDSTSVGFEQNVLDVVRRLRAAISDGLHSVKADITRPQSVSRLLGMDKNLGWKICRLVRDENTVSAVPLIPGSAGMKILTNALVRAGAPAEHVHELRAAFAALEELIELHAGDREKLEIMLGNVTNDGQRERAESHRKLAFRGNSATWGVQARVQLCASFIAPGSSPRMADLAWISGLVDFWRLRRDATWAMAAARKTADDGSLYEVGEIHALDDRFDQPTAVPLMGDFCSRPLPAMCIMKGADGALRYELVEESVGSAATTTCIIGLYGRNFFPRYRAENDTRGEHFVRLYTPVETLIHDLFVHQELTYALSPDLALYSQMPGGPAYPTAGPEHGRLAVYDPVIDLGAGPPDVVTPEYPSYPQLVRAVFKRMSWNPTDFHGYRFRLRYPPIPTVALWRYELMAPER